MKKHSVKKISVSDWIKIPDNPRQRDTEKRAKTAVRKHLSQPSESQNIVYAAAIDGDIVCKVDGHTRALLWNTGRLARPSGNLTMIVYHVRNMKEAGEVYTTHDSQSAMEKSTDRTFGACRESGVVLKSEMLRSYAFATAMHLCVGRRDNFKEYALVETLSDEIAELDSWGLSKINTAITGAALFILKHTNFKEKAKEFFTMLDKGHGIKDSSGYCGVQLLNTSYKLRSVKRMVCGWNSQTEIFNLTLKCFLMFLKGSRHKGNVSPIMEGISREKFIEAIGKLKVKTLEEMALERICV